WAMAGGVFALATMSYEAAGDVSRPDDRPADRRAAVSPSVQKAQKALAEEIHQFLLQCKDLESKGLPIDYDKLADYSFRANALEYPDKEHPPIEETLRDWEGRNSFLGESRDWSLRADRFWKKNRLGHMEALDGTDHNLQACVFAKKACPCDMR